MAALYRFCPRCGAAAKIVEQRIVTCAVCDLVLFINAAAAAGVIIRDARGYLLFVVRQHEPDKGKLGLPGGFVEFGESVEDSVRREVREEINLELADVRYLCSFPNEYEYKGVRYQTLDLFFEAQVNDQTGLHGNEEVAEIVLLAPREIELERIAFGSVRKAVAAAVRGERP